MKPIVVSGAGVGGNGAIVNNSGGNPIYDGGSGGLTPSLTLAGNTTIGGNTRMDLAGPRARHWAAWREQLQSDGQLRQRDLYGMGQSDH